MQNGSRTVFPLPYFTRSMEDTTNGPPLVASRSKTSRRAKSLPVFNPGHREPFLLFGLRENGTIMLIPFHHFLHVVFRAGEIDSLDESRAVRAGCSLIPFEHVAATCIVIRQCVRQRVVCATIPRQKLSQIP